MFQSIPAGSNEIPILINFFKRELSVPIKEKFKIDIKIASFKDKPSNETSILEKLIEKAEFKKIDNDIPMKINKQFKTSFDCSETFKKYGSSFWITVLVKIKYKNHALITESSKLFSNMKQFELK
jgi:hypothetical protein